MHHTFCLLSLFTDVMNCYYHAAHPDSAILSINTYYWDLKDELLRFEEKLVRVLNFQMSVKHPIHYVLHFVRELEGMKCTQYWY